MHEAARAKLFATAMHTAYAAAKCAEGGQAYQGFHGELQAVIDHDPFIAPPDPNLPSQAEIAAFKAIAARATRA